MSLAQTYILDEPQRPVGLNDALALVRHHHLGRSAFRYLCSGYVPIPFDATSEASWITGLGTGSSYRIRQDAKGLWTAYPGLFDDGSRGRGRMDGKATANEGTEAARQRASERDGESEKVADGFGRRQAASPTGRNVGGQVGSLLGIREAVQHTGQPASRLHL